MPPSPISARRPVPTDRSSALPNPVPVTPNPADRPSPNRPRSAAGTLASLVPFARRKSSPPSVSAPSLSPQERARRQDWNVQSAVSDMSAFSDVRVKRWLKKSASDQYLYAKSLTPAQRDELEQALDQTMRGDTPEAQQAMTMWLSVQQARLRTHAQWHQEVYRRQQLHNFIVPYVSVIGVPLAVPLHVMTRTEYYRSLYRPEYPRAFNNFMSVIADPSLSQAIRRTARLSRTARRHHRYA